MTYLAVGLLIVIGAVWLIGKIAEEIGNEVNRYKKNAAANQRSRVMGWCEYTIPSNLDAIARQIGQFESRLPSVAMRQPPPFRYELPNYPRYVKLLPANRQSSAATIDVGDLQALRVFTYPLPADLIATVANHRCEFRHQMPQVPELPEWRKDIKQLQVDLPRAEFRIKPDFQKKESEVRQLLADTIAEVSAAESRLASLAERITSVNATVDALNASYHDSRGEYEQQAASTYAQAVQRFRSAERIYLADCRLEREEFQRVVEGYSNGELQGVVEYFTLGLRLISTPGWMSNSFKVGLDAVSRALVIEVELPNLPDLTFDKPRMGKRERKRLLDEVHPSCLLRVACEAARLDTLQRTSLIAVNGWVNYRSRTTGKPLTAYVTSLTGNTLDLQDVALADADPIASFRHFRGQSAFVVDDVVPIRPSLVLDRDDPRFIEGRDVIEGLGAEANLATMEWQDFEHLIRELFERLYSGEGVEVKVTQASRDRGVDAVVLDPDPIRGGKTVIQAKRYINTVELSAVRDLYGTVHNEGATRGILVTTSNFGPDAYQFAAGKPLALINGSELLRYLKDAGKNVRIDLEEARRLAALSAR